MNLSGLKLNKFVQILLILGSNLLSSRFVGLFYCLTNQLRHHSDMIIMRACHHVICGSLSSQMEVETIIHYYCGLTGSRGVTGTGNWKQPVGPI